MAGVTNREFWDFRVKTRAQFTKLAEQIANIDTSGGGGISELTSKMVVDALGYTPYNANNPANYITSAALSPYLKTEDAEGTYATKDFVNNKLVDYAPLTSVQGFENRIGGLEGAVPQLNERVETVESKVATLNEYVVTGDNNLLNRVNVIEQEYATKTYVDSVEQLAATKLDSSYFTLANIKSTLGISDWALTATKPSYTAAEVGALSLDGTSKMQQSKNIEWSNTEGYEDIDVFSNGLRLLGYNESKGNYGGGIHIGTRYGWQLMTKYGENPLYYRSYNIGSQIWRDWERLAFASDIPTKLSQLTDDVVAGRYLPLSGGNVASLTIGGNTAIHSGNIGSQFVEGIGTAYANQSINFGSEGKVRMIYVTASNATDLGYPVQYASGLSVVTGYTGWQMVTYGGTILPNPYFRKIADNGTWLDWKQLAFLDDNVASATKLATARTIWGQSFDGTGNVSGDINNAAGGIYIHNTNEINSFQGKLYLNHRGSELPTGYGSTNDIVMVANGGNVGIGTTSPTERLDVLGNIKASGNINATSITINGVTITASNGTITVNGNVFAKGDITGGV